MTKKLGFSLIEVLVSLLVLMIAALTITKFQADLIKTGAYAKQRVEAISFAQDAIDTMRQKSEILVCGMPTGNEFDNITTANCNSTKTGTLSNLTRTCTIINKCKAVSNTNTNPTPNPADGLCPNGISHKFLNVRVDWDDNSEVTISGNVKNESYVNLQTTLSALRKILPTPVTCPTPTPVPTATPVATATPAITATPAPTAAPAYPAYVPGKVYVAGDKASKAGVNYSAKWWTNQAPPGEAWKVD